MVKKYCTILIGKISMAELIHMRQRIKTVETIKKITHAMRLVSMSAHAKLNKQYNAIAVYHAGITNILTHIKQASALLSPQKTNLTPDRTLLIVIGSQKGLCGSFNSTLFHALDNYIIKINQGLQIISVGKKMVDYVQEKYKALSIQPFPHLTPANASAIAHTITDRIFMANHVYTTVTVLSNAQKNFFIQTPRIAPLLPVPVQHDTQNTLAHDYTWDVDPQALVEHLTKQYISSAIHKALLESLLAEHAARFVSMDSSTRNAEKILETTRLKYNKLRQAKITKELLELADTF